MRNKTKEKIKKAIGKGIGWAFLDFFKKEYVEKERYDELFALWLLTYPGLRSYVKCMEFEVYANRECEVKNKVIIALDDVEEQLLEYFRKSASLIVEGIEKELKETRPKNIYERVEIEKQIKSLRERIGEELEEVLNKDLTYYDELLDIEILDGIGYAIDRVLGEGKAKEHFRKKVEENITLLTPKGKLAFLVLSADPMFVEDRSAEGQLSEIYMSVLRVITQETNLFVEEFKEGIEELIIAGLLAGKWHEKVVVPPFAVEFWETAVKNPVIINDVPREIVERVRTIISWRGGQNDRGKDQIL